MPSIPDLPDDSLYLADQPTRLAFGSAACIADTITELWIERAGGTEDAAFLVVDFTGQPHILAALRRFPEPSVRGESRWSWLEHLADAAEDEPVILWRCDVTAVGDDAVTFAIIGEATPEIDELLTSTDTILVAAEEPALGDHVLDRVLIVMPSAPAR